MALGPNLNSTCFYRGEYTAEDARRDRFEALCDDGTESSTRRFADYIRYSITVPGETPPPSETGGFLVPNTPRRRELRGWTRFKALITGKPTYIMEIGLADYIVEMCERQRK